MKEGQIVIVLDLGNYKASYAEQTPFKAELYQITDYPCYWVRSKKTGKEYEIYKNQILEGLDIEEITKLIDLSKYGW